jgi:hypothetical protein
VSQREMLIRETEKTFISKIANAKIEMNKLFKNSDVTEVNDQLIPGK